MRSRPLRTGKQFLLVIPSQRIINAAWDKAMYAPGDQARLAVTGTHLPGPLEFVVEREQEDRTWFEVQRLRPEINGDGTEATARFAFPPERDQDLSDGYLTEAEWDCSLAQPRDTLGMHVEGMGLEGIPLLHAIEREEHGKWVEVARWDASLSDSKADSTHRLPLPPPEPLRSRGSLVSAKFDDPERLASGQTIWAAVRAAGLEGAPLHIELQRESALEQWETVGSSVTSVKCGEARSALALPDERPAEKRKGALLTAGFGDGLRAGDSTDLVVHTDHLDGQELEFVLEAEDARGEWREVAAGTAVVRAGEARAHLRVPGAMDR
jgi:hypothetical protein